MAEQEEALLNDDARIDVVDSDGFESEPSPPRADAKLERFWSSSDEQVEIDVVADNPKADEGDKGERAAGDKRERATGDEEEEEDDEDDEDYNPSASEGESDDEVSELSELSSDEDIESEGLDVEGLLEKDRLARQQQAEKERAAFDDDAEEGEEGNADSEEEYEYKEPRVGLEVQVQIADRLSDEQISAMRKVHRFYSPDPRVGSVQWAGDVIPQKTTKHYVNQLRRLFSNMKTQLSMERALNALHRSGYDTNKAHVMALANTTDITRVADTITPAEHELMLYFLEAHHAAKQKQKDWKYAAREFIKTAPVGHVLNHYYMWKGSPSYAQWRRDLMKRLFGEPQTVLVNGTKRGDLQRVYVDGTIDWEDVNQSKKEAAMIIAATAESRKSQSRSSASSEVSAERDMKRRHDRLLASNSMTLSIVPIPPKSTLQQAYCSGEIIGFELSSGSP